MRGCPVYRTWKVALCRRIVVFCSANFRSFSQWLLEHDADSSMGAQPLSSTSSFLYFSRAWCIMHKQSLPDIAGSTSRSWRLIEPPSHQSLSLGFLIAPKWLFIPSLPGYHLAPCSFVCSFCAAWMQGVRWPTRMPRTHHQHNGRPICQGGWWWQRLQGRTEKARADCIPSNQLTGRFMGFGDF